MSEGKGWMVPLTGAAFIVVAIIGFIVSGEPKDASHPANEIVDWYVDNKDSVEVGAFIGVAATVLLVFFAAYLRNVLRAAAGGQRPSQRPSPKPGMSQGLRVAAE